MTTPASGQISLGDLKSELSLVGGPSVDISLTYSAFFVMADGFWDTYGFTGQTSGYGAAPVNLSSFYSLQTDASFDFQVDSSITDYVDFSSFLTNITYASGGAAGPNAQQNPFYNPQGGVLQPGTSNAENIVHMQELEVTVSCTNVSPVPPFTDLYLEWNNGGGFTAFPGSPINGLSISISSGIQDNAPNNVGTPTFVVRCYQ
jgi:hypothetical protein